MSTYTVELSPVLVNLGTEGSLDTSVTGGNSLQRSVHGIMVVDNHDRKMVGRIADGGTFTDSFEGLSDLDFLS